MPVRCLTVPAPRAVIEANKCACKAYGMQAVAVGAVAAIITFLVRRSACAECTNMIQDIHEDEDND
jgi:hypothetical protein